MDETSGYEVRGAWCQMCGPARTHCYTRCYLKDGKWRHVEGCPNAGNNGVFGSVTLCAKGNAAPSSLPPEGRLVYPLRRVGAKGPGARFERITWDEALDTIAETLLAQKDAYGPESFGILSPQAYAVLASLGRRFLNVHGSPNYLHSAICAVQQMASANTVVGGPLMFLSNSTIPQQLDKTELLVNWGANPENAGVNQGEPRARMEQMERGMKVIDIRPLCDPLASKADVWLAVRPGTDLALALGFLHVICGEGLYDHEFVASWCHGFDELAAHVRPYTPEWAAEHCGVPADAIRTVARMIAAAKPCAINFGNGIGDQSRDGHWTVCAVQLIGAICGNLGKPGGGADRLGLYPPLIDYRRAPDTLSGRLPESEEDRRNGWPAGASKLVAPEFPRWYQPPGNGGPTSSYLGGLMSVLTEEPYPLRAVFAQSTNPLSATRQPSLVAQALEKVDFFFVMDLYHNPSCDFADIVLPAASQYECSHTIGFKNFPEGSFLAISQKVADPPGEAMSDWELYLKLGERMGYGDDFWHGDVEAYLADQVASTGYTIAQLRDAPDGIFVPRDQDAAGQPPAAAPGDALYARMFAGLPHGKIQCVNDLMGGKPDRVGGTLPKLPRYLGPVEGLAETPELARDYPYVFSDVHAHALSQHGYYGNVGLVREYEPDPWVKINPATAARHGIAEGDWVRIESPHGWCVLKARLTQGVSPEVLMGRRGWHQGCPELGRPGYSWLDGGAETNVLYDGDLSHADQFHSSMGKQTLVRIARSDRPPVTLDELAGSCAQGRG